MRLPRPYIPLRVRVQVAERQFIEKFGFKPTRDPVALSDGKWLAWLLRQLFGDKPVELHHRPALVNRQWFCNTESKSIFCVPDANNPDYLVYLPADEHDIETRVRGQHGQHSDLALARKRKRMEKKREQRKNLKPASRLRSRMDFHGRSARPAKVKHRWPKRKLRSRPFGKSARRFRK